MEIRINTVTPEVFLELYRSVGWEPPCIEQASQALKNTIATFAAFDNGRAVGMVRLIGDGGMSFYIIIRSAFSRMSRIFSERRSGRQELNLTRPRITFSAVNPSMFTGSFAEECAGL